MFKRALGRDCLELKKKDMRCTAALPSQTHLATVASTENANLFVL